jgi:hypothetical protein
VNRNVVRALADLAEALARLATELAREDLADPKAMLPLDEATRVAGTSKRVLRDAIRHGDLPAYGRQCDRSVRRADLDAWTESRRVPVREGPDDADIERRIARIERERRVASSLARTT